MSQDRRKIDALAPGVVDAARREGWLDLRGDRARLTPPGWLRIDEIVTA